MKCGVFLPKGKQTFPHKISRSVSWVGDVVCLTVNLAAALCREAAKKKNLEGIFNPAKVLISLPLFVIVH